jgi:hypothetical protein
MIPKILHNLCYILPLSADETCEYNGLLLLWLCYVIGNFSYDLNVAESVAKC